MTKRDQAHAKRCASVRFPGVEFAPMSNRANSAKARRIPKLGRHSSGQARVTLNGKAVYCGPRGTTEAHARYAELNRAWQDRSEQPAERAPHPTQASLRLGDLLQQFLDHVDTTGRYRKNGAPTRPGPPTALQAVRHGAHPGRCERTQALPSGLLRPGGS